MEAKQCARGKSDRPRPGTRAWLTAVACKLVLTGAATGCLDRPVMTLEPNTSNLFVDQSLRAAIDRIDLLFMIDNSASMQDKQDLLALAVPNLLRRLLNPPCIDVTTRVATDVAGPSSECPPGSEREFSPVADVHIAIVSSSLGDHGQGSVCTGKPQNEDGAHLINAATRPENPALTGTNGLGFLAWDNRPPGDPRKPQPAGENDLERLGTDFKSFVKAVGEDGCGYEASLEAWYRFLIDPTPPARIVRTGDFTTPEGIDSVVLDQRKAFLRSDSLVAIVMLSDENDCSIRDSGYGWLAAHPAGMALGTSACQTDPNDPCCTYCGYDAAPPGCLPINQDPNCAPDRRDQHGNVRCWDQKRRFGIDLLYPTSRYSTGLDSAELCPESTFGDADCDCRRAKELGVDCIPGRRVRNPLYTDLQASGNEPVPAAREPDLVFLAGIVGVPWQDLATEDTVSAAGKLKYKPAGSLDWGLILGNPGTANEPFAPPEDTLMRESTAPRLDGQPHPITKVAPAPPESGPEANPINGHEWLPESEEDLQYACVFDLEPILGDGVRDCQVVGEGTCDCFPPNGDLGAVQKRMKPLCQGANGYSSVQVRAKAYPGLRHLDVLHRYGNNSIVASICPKVLEGAETDPAYGYNPAIEAIIERLKIKLRGRCLPRRLSYDEGTNRVPCAIVEAFSGRYSESSLCPAGRTELDSSLEEDRKLDASVRRLLAESKKCGGGATPCEAFQLCKIEQLQDENLRRCQNQAGDIGNAVGYCYVAATADQSIGNPDLVSLCPDSQKRMLRFAGKDVPAQGAHVFIGCAGDTFSRTADAGLAPVPPDGG